MTESTDTAAPDYMTQSARVSLDAYGNVLPQESTESESAAAGPATATPRATKERP